MELARRSSSLAIWEKISPCSHPRPSSPATAAAATLHPCPLTSSPSPCSTRGQGLAKALAAHRQWAGQFGVDDGGGRAILLNDAGVRFVDATADVALSRIMPVEPTPELLRMQPGGTGAEELMLVQVTRFPCGSFVVGAPPVHHTPPRRRRLRQVRIRDRTRGATPRVAAAPLSTP
ncbi:hypothetical protein C2845_PMPSC049114 [Panicum miliaceum]|uniref:Uncharacterized protein n=1 Tax=Panicum miliaceum TaxID=4540 RepID=A0A3L6P9L4_PANMI|nr:hypothetical protein C2845_PMPSC049114 [Panicum miliaceum]